MAFGLLNWLRALLVVVCLPVLSMAQAAHPSTDISAELSTTSVHAGDSATLAVIVTVHDGLHAQSHTPFDEYAIKFDVSTDKNSSVEFGAVEYPKPQELTLPQLGKLSVYEGRVVFYIPVKVKGDAKPGALKLSGKLTYQACNDVSCFGPETPVFGVDSKVVPANIAVEKNPAFPAKAPDATTAPATRPAALAPVNPTSNDQGSVLGFNLDKSGVPLAYSAAFVIGIIFNLMPCVLPVLPLKIMGFYEVSQHSRGKSVALGAVFSAGLIASFAVLASLVVGSSKLPWGALFEHTWFTVTISTALVILAFSTFGLFTVNVPNSLYSFTPRHDTYVGNFLFGVLTAALSTPCTFGMFAGLLLWALKQPAWVGGGSIVMVGVGMASPYFILSAIPEVARKFPRTGPWAEVVKQMMGFLLLATAVYFARPLFQHRFSDDLFYWLLFAVMAAGAIFLVGRSMQLSKGLLPRLIAVIIAVAIMAPSFYIVRRLTERPFVWEPYSAQAVDSALASGKPVLIDFTATWCGNCHYLEAFVLHDSKVVHAVNDKSIVMLQADVTNEGAVGRPLLAQLNPAGSIPLTAVYFPNQAQPTLLNGIYSASDLLKTLR